MPRPKAILDLAVVTGTLIDILNEQADGIIDEEVDLVLAPRTGSQIEIAEQMTPSLIVCWAGNSDVLGTVTSFDQLDASQLISVADYSGETTGHGASGRERLTLLRRRPPPEQRIRPGSEKKQGQHHDADAR